MPQQGPDLKDLFERMRRDARSGGGSATSLVDRIAAWSRRALVVCAVLLAVALVVLYWWFHPALNLQSPQVWSWILIIAVVADVGVMLIAVLNAMRTKLIK